MKEKLFHQIVTPLWVQATGGGIDGAFRKAVSKAIQNGRQIFQSIFQKTGKSTISDIPPVFSLPERVKVFKPSLQRVVFDGLFPKVSIRTLAAELRRRAALQGISGAFRHSGNGRNLPLFAFLGVGIATHETFQNKESNICANIRELVQKFDLSSSCKEDDKPSAFSLADLEFGSFIEKGCNAAVYEARYVPKYEDKSHTIIDGNIHASIDDTKPCKETVMENFDSCTEDSHKTETSTIASQGLKTSEELHLADTSDIEFDDISILSLVSDEESGEFTGLEEHFEFVGAAKDRMSEKEGLFLVIDDGSSDIIVLNVDEEESDLQDEENPEIDKPPNFDLAVKMMFNYDAESNILSISQAMRKETIPARMSTTQQDTSLHLIREEDDLYLPPHPNIVDMKDVFVGNMPELPEACSKYPAALPVRLHENGLGRNMTMFLVMKRYSSTLREYLIKNNVDMSTRLLLLAQLLEGIEHISFHGTAHRDLKSNNILIDDDTADGKPRLVISDFGCCLADKENGLKIPYISCEQPKGGNPSLMAPEIACAMPSRSGRAILDYSKSDLWAAGSLAYEIFGLENPFYAKRSDPGKALMSGTYKISDLPSLPDQVPEVIKQLIYNMLNPDVQKRLKPSTAATVIQMFLWNQSVMKTLKKPFSVNDLKSVILLLTLEVISSKLFQSENNLELDLKYSLLKRLTETDLYECVSFYCDNL